MITLRIVEEFEYTPRHFQGMMLMGSIETTFYHVVNSANVIMARCEDPDTAHEIVEALVATGRYASV